MNEKQFNKLAVFVFVLVLCSPLFPSSIGMANESECSATDYTLLNTNSLEYFVRECFISFSKWTEGENPLGSQILYGIPTLESSNPIESVNYSQILLPNNFSLEGYDDPEVIWNNSTYKICTCITNYESLIENDRDISTTDCKSLVGINGEVYSTANGLKDKEVYWGYSRKIKWDRRSDPSIVFHNGYVIADGGHNKNILDQHGKPILKNNFRDTREYCGLIVSRMPSCIPDRLGRFIIIAQEYNPWFNNLDLK